MATAFAVFCATDGSLTFYNRDSVPSVGDIFEGKAVSNVYTGFDTSNYVSPSSVPWYVEAASIINVSFMPEFATVKPISISNWFRNMSNLQTFDGTNLNTSNVTAMSSVFSGCSSLTSLDLSNFDTSNVTKMGIMFNRCTALTYIDLSSFDTSNVTEMLYMFEWCSALTSLDLSNFDTSNVTEMTQMFMHCSSLEKIYVSSSWSIASGTLGNMMFLGCTSLVGAVPFDGNKTNVSMANYETGYFTYKRYVKPEDMLIKNTTLYDMADKIRILSGTEDSMTPATMDTKLGSANSEVSSQTDIISQIIVICEELLAPSPGTDNDSTHIPVTITGTGYLDANDRFYVYVTIDDVKYISDASVNVSVGDTIMCHVSSISGAYVYVNDSMVAGAAEGVEGVPQDYEYIVPENVSSIAVELKYAKTSSTIRITITTSVSEPTLISFTIDGTSYQAEEGMTWTEWVDSKYNVDRFGSGGGSVTNSDDADMRYVCTTSDSADTVNSNDVIQKDYEYYLISGESDAS